MTDFNQNITCPYCGHEDEEHNDYPQGLENDGDECKYRCCECDRDFFVTLCVEYTFGSTELGEYARMKAKNHQRESAYYFSLMVERRDKGDTKDHLIYQRLASTSYAQARDWLDVYLAEAKRD